MLDDIIAGQPMKGQPLTPEEADMVDKVLRRLSYRLRHRYSQVQPDVFPYSACYYVLGAIMDIREVLAHMADPTGMERQQHEEDLE